MQVVVIKPGKFWAGILKKIFKIKQIYLPKTANNDLYWKLFVIFQCEFNSKPTKNLRRRRIIKARLIPVIYRWVSADLVRVSAQLTRTAYTLQIELGIP